MGGGGGPGGVPPDSPTSDPIFQTKKCYFHTRFLTWCLKSIPVFRPGRVTKRCVTCLHKTEIVTIAEIETATKRFHFNFAYYTFFLIYLELIHTGRINHAQFQTKVGKIYTSFHTKTAQKPYPLGRGTYLFSNGLYKGVLPRAESLLPLNPHLKLKSIVCHFTSDDATIRCLIILKFVERSLQLINHFEY